MRGTVLLVTWVVRTTVSPVQCPGTDCRPTRAGTVVTHTVGTCATREACEAQRPPRDRHGPPPVVQRAARPDGTRRQPLIAGCQEGGEAR